MRKMTVRRALLAPAALGLFLAAALGSGSFAQSSATAAELVMLERPGCAWCARWNREIAPIYPLTEEGRQAPLRRVDVTEPWPEDLEDVAGDRYTPTFVLVEDGREIARLRGYPGDNFFWPLLGEMLGKLPSEDAESDGPADSS
jgi:hypothetical protein